MTDRSGALAIISNRAPYQLKERFGRLSCERNVGGLVSVLDEMMCRSGGTWIAWGEGWGSCDEVGIPPDAPAYSLRPVPLTDQEVNHYYHGFSNRVLWPLSHYFLDRCHFRSEYWRSYQAVNEKFARAFRESGRHHDLVWIHDFHLTLLPALLRKGRPHLSIGFFWHIPFPASPVFRVLPWREEVLRGLLGSDLIGFHLPLHAEHFLRCVQDVIHTPVDCENGSILYDGRVIKVGVFPVGIDFRKWSDLASSPIIAEKARELREELGAKYIILGVDRLDYTKGIRERLLAFERFLEKYPQFHGQVCMIQTAVPSRTRVDEYRSLRREIDECIGRITGRFTARKWIPLRYLYRGFPIEELVTYYLAADLALITPLRDGMNLVAKEYVASRVKQDGGLILSEFTGAAGTLTDAIIVNPYDIEGLADAIHFALSMPDTEKRRRMERLRQAVKERDVYWWCETFLKSLAGRREPSQ
ncbi:MAG: trehalose-6-phosphate synthase [Deltaproteobacteria bacterium]|nr:trehalose-6-phosphate synthase [Deltaproteobacteria bacterium]